VPSTALIYLGIFLAAAVEGEVVFVAASVSVALGHLDRWAVLVAGALGGSVGDQCFFYAFRGPLRPFLDRFPGLANKRKAIGRLIEEYAIPLTAACRFLPGLRIAIPAACAQSSLPAPLFSAISLLSAFGWAAAILGLITGAGPAALHRLGMARNWALGASAIVVLGLFIALGRITLGAERRAQHGPAAP
jgi:membrane protein DedA with SNARE-associated domain